MGVGGRTVPSLELLPHSEEVVGSNSQAAWSLHVHPGMALSRYQLTGDSILSVCVCVLGPIIDRLSHLTL